jgi:hypothetical protein
VATDADLPALLRSHGLSARTADLLPALGGALVREARRLQVEVATVVDAQTGEVPGGMVTGEVGEVGIAALLRAMRPERHYVALHTHRQSTSFSDRDLEALYDRHERTRSIP